MRKLHAERKIALKDLIELENYPVILTVSDIAEFIEKSIPYTYMLTERREFPSVQIGGRTLVSKNRFLTWLLERV